MKDINAPIVRDFDNATEIDRISLASTTLEHCFGHQARALIVYTTTQEQTSHPMLQATDTLCRLCGRISTVSKLMKASRAHGIRQSSVLKGECGGKYANQFTGYDPRRDFEKTIVCSGL